MSAVFSYADNDSSADRQIAGEDPDELRPPLITLDMASVGYGETPVLSRLNLRLDPDDRIALLGRNGNGKTTLARLLAAQLKPMDGAMNASGKAA